MTARPSGATPPDWLADRWRYDPLLEHADYDEGSGLGLTLGAADFGVREDPYHRWTSLCWWRAGFPLPAFDGAVKWDHGSRVEVVERAAIPAPEAFSPVFRDLPDRYGYLPLHPVWPGLAVDTFIYATFAYLIARLTILVWRKLQTKPGHCTFCGYDRHGLAQGAPCPECGKAATKPA